MMNIGGDFKYDAKLIDTQRAKLGLADKWILTELNQTAKTMNTALEGFHFSDATTAF